MAIPHGRIRAPNALTAQFLIQDPAKLRALIRNLNLQNFIFQNMHTNHLSMRFYSFWVLGLP